LISIVALVETSLLKFTELKKFVLPRTALSAVAFSTLVLGAGLFIYSSLLLMPMNETIVDDFEGNLIGVFSNEENSEELIDMTLDIYIDAQKNTVMEIISLPTFPKLLEKEDEDVNTFAIGVLEFNDYLSSSAYRQELKSELIENWDTSLPGTTEGIAFDLIEREFPIYRLLKSYFWLIETIFFVSFFFLVANLLIKPISAVYASVFGGVLFAIEKVKKDLEKTG